MDFALRSDAVVIYIFPGCTSDIHRGPERRGLSVAAVTVDISLECSTAEWYVVSCILLLYLAEILSPSFLSVLVGYFWRFIIYEFYRIF